MMVMVKQLESGYESEQEAVDLAEEMSPEELVRLDESIERSMKDFAEGRYYDAREVVELIRARRK